MSEKNINSAIGVGRCFFPVLKAIKFILLSYIMSVILLALIAVLIVYTSVPESVMTVSVKLVTFFGAFVSSFFTCRHTLSKGWICGILTALFHVLLLHVISAFCVGTELFALTDVSLLVISALCGFAGGIIGVNCADS